MTAITGSAIQRFQLITWRSAIKLEKMGRKRKGIPVARIVRSHFKLTSNVGHDELIALLDEKIKA